MQDWDAQTKKWTRGQAKLAKKESFALKDEISIIFSATSLVISLALFWINVVQVKHELQVSVAGVTTWPNGDIQLDVAFLNTGNREAAVVRGELLLWRDDFKLANGWHAGGWQRYFNMSNDLEQTELFSLKPGEVKLVKVSSKLDLKLMRAQISESRLSASRLDRTVAIGLLVHALDGRGKRYVAEIPAIYQRYSVDESDGQRRLWLGRADYAHPAESVDILSVGSRAPYAKDAPLSFTSKLWQVTGHVEQSGVRFAQSRLSPAPSN